ncbi:MAG: hypothetical protein MRJ93_10280 [Nitrososphaeraceae archaeon]|nr:hypothetical protein [Nitrososphaeraceae archaeon]
MYGQVGNAVDALINLTPDGAALPLGLISTSLRILLVMLCNLLRVGIKQPTAVSPPDVLKRLQTGGSPDAFKDSEKWNSGVKTFGEEPLLNSLQWDMVFDDGAMFKN